MRRPEKVTKSEIFSLCCTVLFLLGVLVLRLTVARGDYAGYVVQPQRSGAEGETAELLDLNRADAAALERLPGVGPTLAARIVDYRRAHGAFASVEELLQVEGVGPATLEGLRPYVTVDGQRKGG
ncbi:MAG: helix-hairpin-helix domain-containing protein [Oscillospiraceae bacterium]|nr:helix-hairpin-helix domain-containing protein [Oscillospiraceae bacterium]